MERFLERADPGAPKHAGLTQAMAALIEAGHWKPGEKFPAEQELAAALPLSLGTIQRAVRTLVEQGLVVRRSGAGTFVADPKRLLEYPLHCRFAGPDGFLPVYSRLLSRRLIASRGPWSVPLRQSGRNVLRIDREISVNNEFALLSRFYVDLHRFPSLLTRPAEELAAANIKLLLAREQQVNLSHVEQSVTLCRLPPFPARVLKVAEGTTGLRADIVGLERDGGAATYQELFIPPTGHRLVVSDRYSPAEWGVPAQPNEAEIHENHEGDDA